MFKSVVVGLSSIQKTVRLNAAGNTCFAMELRIKAALRVARSAACKGVTIKIQSSANAAFY